MLFDEPESGVDIENMALIGTTISQILEKDTPRAGTNVKPFVQQRSERTKMGFIITHTGYILDYVPADKGQVLYNGILACAGNPREIFQCIGRLGYEECVKCTV